MRCFCAGLATVTGLVLLVLGGLTIRYFEPFINRFIYSELVVMNGTSTFELFLHPPVEPVLRAYFFNVSNPTEFLAGSKPILHEVGPYTYRQHWERVNMTVNGNGTISSALKKTYFFDRARSVGPESDELTILNVPMVTAVWQARFLPRFIQLIFSSMLEVLHEEPFSRRNVSDFLWGYKDPLLEMARDILPPHQRLPTDSFGFFLDKNGTAPTLLTQYQGSVDDMSNYMAIERVNGRRFLDFWLTNECNKIKGSDGAAFPPDVKRGHTLFLYNPALCRSLPLQYEQDVERYGVKGYRFTPPDDVFDYVENKPENECYCVGGPPCLGGGLFNLSVCQHSSPAVLSWPHFFKAHPKYLEAVEGLHPDADKHQFFVDVAPRTGVPLVAEARIQINMALTNVTEIKPAAGLRPMIFPVVWFQDGVPQLPDDVVAQLRMSSNLPEVLKMTLLTLLFVFGCVLFVGGVTIFVQSLVTRRHSASLTSDLNGQANPAMDWYPEKD